jgi:hypothetical protein
LDKVAPKSSATESQQHLFIGTVNLRDITPSDFVRAQLWERRCAATQEANMQLQIAIKHQLIARELFHQEAAKEQVLARYNTIIASLEQPPLPGQGRRSARDQCSGL